MIGNYKTGKYYLAFSYGVIGILFYLLSVYTPLMADDFSFAYMYDRNGANISSPIMNLYDIVISQYNHYFVSNGRTPVQFIEQLFAGLLGRDSFNLFNALIFLLFLWVSASLLVQKEKSTLYCIGLCFYYFGFYYLYRGKHCYGCLEVFVIYGLPALCCYSCISFSR